MIWPVHEPRRAGGYGDRAGVWRIQAHASDVVVADDEVPTTELGKYPVRALGMRAPGRRAVPRIKNRVALDDEAIGPNARGAIVAGDRTVAVRKVFTWLVATETAPHADPVIVDDDVARLWSGSVLV